MAPPVRWNSNTAYAVGVVVRAYTDNGGGFYYRCVVAGTSGAVEPFWPTTINNEVQDGTITWIAVSIIAGALQTPAPDAIIEMFELSLSSVIHGTNEIYRFHAGSNNLEGYGNIFWKNNEYLHLPIEADGFEYNGQGQLPRPKIRVSNLSGTITAILLTLPNGLEGAKLTRLRTLARYLDPINFPPSGGALLTEDNFYLLMEDGGRILLESINASADEAAEFPQEIFYIDRKTAETRDVVEFEMVSAMDLAGVRAPKRQCIGNICQWRYRSNECGYNGTNYFNSEDVAVSLAELDVCGKRLASCKARFGANAELPFGSFPGINSATA
jgi:phage-related protein